MEVTRGCLPDAAPSTPRFPALARTALACVLALAALATPALAQTGICGRTAVVQTFILAKIEGVSACADVTGTHLAAITGSLLLNSESITALAAGDFAGLTSLTNLYLNNNELTALPSGVFDGLTALRLLRLVENGLITFPAGVFDELTSLRDLYLHDNALATLPAGVFAGLTALRNLTLYDNVLIALPADVFEPLTSLTSLYLHHNDLATLPAGVFDALTALTDLQLHSNDLTTLPADVFEPLTSLTNRLYLDDNPGAPFAPVAVALPDDGTVSSAGGTVRLDGSGSDGGPWGEYVTYSWALTNPSSGVTVTFDDAGSATPVVTIPALPANTELTFTLTVAGRSGSDGVTRGTDAARVSVPATNVAPSFTSAENQTAVGTVQASDGDNSDSVTGYAIDGGADASKFSIVASTGVLTFASAPNYEDATDADGDNAYVVVVRATSGAGARVTTADQTITVTVTDADGEAPGVPAAPSVSAAGVTSVTVSWAPPANAGPAITDYDYQYRVKTPPGSWAEVTNTPITAPPATIMMLAENTEYDVQVRATNAEGTSGWSESGTGQTTASVPGAPSGLTATASWTTRIDLSWTAPASTGGSAITGYKIEVSSDTGASWTDLVANTGDANTTYSQIGLAPGTTRHYRVSAINANGTGDASNVANATTFTTRPGAPTDLTATASWTTQINLSWTTPASDGGSAITTYVIDVSPDGITNWRYRAGNVNADTTYSQIGLAPGTTRHYRVVAINANGFGPNSNIASATTGQATVTFGASVYTAVEGGAAATVEVQLSAALSAPVTIPLEVTLQGGATAADYSGIPETVTFGADQTAVTFTVTATADTDAETGESVSIGFGTLPEGVFARSPATVTLADRSGPGPGPGPTTDPDPTAPPPPPDPEPDPEPEPEPLEVAIVGVPDVAVAGESYELTAQSDEESLVYEWSVAGGTIEPDDAQMVVWTAPETASVAWIHVDVTREDGATAGRSDYVRVEVPEPEPVPALPLIGQLLLGVGLLGGGARRLYRRRRQTTVYDTG